MGIKRWLRAWLMDEGVTLRGANDVAPPLQHTEPQSGNFNISVAQAVNGRVLEMRTYKPQPRGSDWVHEYYVVPEGQSLTEALTMLLVLKGLNT